MWFLFFLSLLILPSYQIEPSKIIIVYFSRPGENYKVGVVEVGNTKMVASYIKQLYNFDDFEIIPETPYPESYNETLSMAKEERNLGTRPNLSTYLTDISAYDVILLGYPIWLQRLPNIVMTQLELLNFEGKKIYPFMTHEGSEAGMSIDLIRKSAPQAKIGKEFILRGTEARNETSHESIKNWVDKILQENQGEGSYIKTSIFILLLILLMF